MDLRQFVLLLSLTLIFTFGVNAGEEKSKDVLISHGIKSIDVQHEGKTITLMRAQDKSNQIVEFYRKTTRGRIQPMHPFAPNDVATIGEREVIGFVQKMSAGDDSIILIDSRTPAWVRLTGVIPGAVNIPFTKFKADNLEELMEILEDQLDVVTGEVFDFSQAKTLVMYCNGVWCGQSPTAIRKLLSIGYPAAKIRYFRGGMQSWTSLGLTVVPLQPQ